MSDVLQSTGQQGVKPHRGTLVLVLGILGLLVCVVCGILAWVLGSTDLKEMDAGAMDPTGRDMTVAGKICGIISVALNVLGLIIVLFSILFTFGILTKVMHQ